MKEKKEEERGGGANLWWLLLRLTVVLAGGSEMAVAVFLSLSLLYFFVFFLFFSSSVFLFFFLSVGWLGRPLCSRPRGASPVLPPCGRQVVSFVGVFLVVSEKREQAKQGRKVFFFPCSLRVQGKRKTYGAVQNDIVFSSFFFFEMYETTLFFLKRAFSFKWKLAPKRIRFKIRPSICAPFHFGPWFRISSIKSLIGHQTSIFMQLSP
jgi:hypothetical protein